MCKDWEEKITSLRDGEKIDGLILEHISMCPKCRVLLKKNSDINREISEMEYIDTSENFNERVFEKIDSILGKDIIDYKKTRIREIYTIAASILLSASILITGFTIHRAKNEMPYSYNDLKQEKTLTEIENLLVKDELSEFSAYYNFKIINNKK